MTNTVPFRFGFFSLLVALSSVANLFAQSTTVSTPIVGFSNINLPSGSAMVVPGFVKPAVYSGSSAVSGQVFSVSGLVSSSFNSSNYSDRPNYPKYYVEITSGPYEGYTFDIISNTTTSVSVSDVPSAMSGLTVSMTIRPHFVLDDLVKNQSGLSDYSDAVNLSNPDGSVTTRFYASGSWLAEDFSTPAGHTVVYPGNGVVFSSGGAKVTTSGNVKTTKTVVPLYSTTINYVGQMNPSGATKVTNLGIAGALSPYSDGMNAFSNDGSLTTVGTYYSDGSAILDAGYSPLAGNAADSVASNSGFAVSVGSSTVWTMPSVVNP